MIIEAPLSQKFGLAGRMFGFGIYRSHEAGQLSTSRSKPVPTWHTTLELMGDYRYTADIRDRIVSILGLHSHGPDLRVDYALDAFHLLLETLWFEQAGASSAACTIEAMKLLNLTPEIMAWYACSQVEFCSRFMDHVST